MFCASSKCRVNTRHGNSQSLQRTESGGQPGQHSRSCVGSDLRLSKQGNEVTPDDAQAGLAELPVTSPISREFTHLGEIWGAGAALARQDCISSLKAAARHRES